MTLIASHVQHGGRCTLVYSFASLPVKIFNTGGAELECAACEPIFCPIHNLHFPFTIPLIRYTV